MVKRIVLVNPPITAEERYGKLKGGGSSAPPLGLCMIGAVLRNNGYDVRIVDAEILGLSIQRTARAVVSYEPDYIGITATTVSIMKAVRLAKHLKAEQPKTPIIIGGPHITAAPIETLKRFQEFDVACLGEGEITMVELLRALDSKRLLENVAGLAFRKGNKVILTAKRPFIKNLDTLPMPAWDILPKLTKYYRPPVFSTKQYPATSLVTSRGCSGKCIFCDRAVFGNICRAFSARYVYNMIMHLCNKYGIRDILIDDDNFTLFRKRLVELCHLLINKPLRVTWSCNSRVDTVTLEILKLMKKAGCWQIAYGIESYSQEVLDNLNKRVTLKQIDRALGWTKKAGIINKGFFMVGCPSESRHSLKATLNFLKTAPLDDFQISPFTPLPGTEVYENAEKYGIFDNDWEKLNMWTMVFVPKGLTKKQLELWTKKAYTAFYFKPRVVLSHISRISSFTHLRYVLGGLFSLTRFLLSSK